MAVYPIRRTRTTHALSIGIVPMKSCSLVLIARARGKGLLPRMGEHNSSPADSLSHSDPSDRTDINERAAMLQKKVGDLSKTFERIEQSLAEAGDERPDLRD